MSNPDIYTDGDAVRKKKDRLDAVEKREDELNDEWEQVSTELSALHDELPEG